MKQLKVIYGISAAILLATAANVYAEEGDMTQTRIQERSRTQLNLQVPMADFAQSQNREEHTVKNQYQNQYQYKYMNNHQNKESDSGASSSMNRMNTTNRYMQGSSATGSMNRTNTASRSMSGGRR